MRNMLATLLLSHGTPMVLAGDEFGRTQQGNNNAYCQDNAISWVNWIHDAKAESLIRFVRTLNAIRRDYPIFRRSRFLSGKVNEELGVKDVTWINATGAEMRDEDWTDQNMFCFGMLTDGRAQATGIARPGEDVTALVVLNAFYDMVRFTLPDCAGGSHWSKLVDTNLADQSEPARFAFGATYDVTGRSLLLFILNSEAPR
jgi:glycogen operon protein